MRMLINILESNNVSKSVLMSVHNYHMIVRSLLHVCDQSMYRLPHNFKTATNVIQSPSRSRVKQIISTVDQFSCEQLPRHISTLPLPALIKPKRQVYSKQLLYCHFLSLIDKWICVMTTVANYKMSIRRNVTILNKVSNTDKFWRKLYTVPIATLELQHGKLDTFCDPVVTKRQDHEFPSYITIVLFLDTLENQRWSQGHTMYKISELP